MRSNIRHHVFREQIIACNLFPHIYDVILSGSIDQIFVMRSKSSQSFIGLYKWKVVLVVSDINNRKKVSTGNVREQRNNMTQGLARIRVLPHNSLATLP